MKRLLRWTLIAAAIFCVLAAGGLIALRILFPPQKLKALALEKLQAALEREIRFESIGIGLRGLTLANLEISERPDFKAGTLLKVGTLRARPRLRPLIEKRIEIATIALKNGAVTYEDRRSGLRAWVRKIDIEAEGAGLTAPFPLSVSCDYAVDGAGSKASGRLDYRGTVDLGGNVPENFALTIKTLTLRLLDVTLTASGQVRNLKAPEAALTLHIPSQRIDSLSALAGSAKKSPFAGRVPAISGEVRAQKSGELIRLQKVDLELGEMKLSVSGSISTPENRPARADLRVKTNSFPLAMVADLHPAARDMHLQGRAELDARVLGPLDAPAVSGEASLASVGLEYAGLELQSVTGRARLSPDKVTATIAGKWNRADFKVDLTAADYLKAPNVRIEGSLSQLDLAALPTERPEIAGKRPPGTPGASGGPAAKNGKSRAGASEPAAASGSHKAGAALPLSTSGKFTVGNILHPNFTASRAELSWSLRDALEPARVTGAAKFKIAEGKFDNLKDVAGKNSMVRTALLPILVLQKVGSLAKIPLFPAFDRVHYKEITGDYAFQSGVMTVKESHMDSSAAHVAVTGGADLGKDQLNLRVSTRLAPQAGIKLGGPIGFWVRGSLSDPSVKADVGAILKQPAVQDAVEQGKKLLENLFKPK
ncbi:MAG: translocation/assembly module TamB domain-containing protein [Elusimicrobia bacterium]|nr:translocation/assembly module TamB domain-containing protein [Elusimicrobiota bacterium]